MTYKVEIAYTLISMIGGGLITWLVARAYYARATRDLRQSVEDLKQSVGELKGVIAFFGGHPERFR